MDSIRTQVIIIGAGPTGLSLAVQLLRYHIDFVILEKNEKTTIFSKALVVQARTLEIFQEIGLADKALAKGRITTGLNIFHKGRRKAAINLSGLGKGLSPFPFALSLDQSETEKLLAEVLSNNNKDILWNSEFIKLEQNEEKVTAFYNDEHGQERSVEGLYLVGCDGAGSPVRHQLELSFKGDTVPKIFYVADVKLESPVINKNQLFFFLLKKGFVLFFPMEGDGHYRVVGILPGKETDNETAFNDVEKSLTAEMSIPINFEELRWFSTYRVHSRKADSFSKGRCFIAGDAAHIHTPAGGQGMNTGIQDAYNLAWKLAFVIRGKLNPALLETYDSEREENAKHLLKTTDRMFDIMAGPGIFWNFIRLHIFPGIVWLVSKTSLLSRKIFPLISQTGISYRNSALTVKSSVGSVKAGDRMPFFIFPDGKGIFDYLSQPVFKILFFGDKKIETEQFQHAGIATFSFTEIPRKLFGNSRNFYIVLRPDNHIAYIGKDISICSSFFLRIGVK